MGHTYSSMHYHIVFSTKYRMRLISPEINNSLCSYLAKIINNEYGFARKINGTEDHIHICADIKSRFSISEVLRKIKANSSAWVNNKFTLDYRFGWQEGYGVFTVSKSSIPSVLKYVQDQMEHHKK